MLGDSNARQYYVSLQRLLGTAEPVSHGFHSHVIAPYNVSLDFQFHPEAIGGRAGLKVSDMQYEVDVIDKLTDPGCNYVIIVSSWAHFTVWQPKALRERFQLLRKAVVRLLTRCPDVPVIFKSAHPREHNYYESKLYSSDFILNEIRKLVREVFVNSGIMFLDIWDMNLAYPTENAVHMPESVILNELFMILSYVCDSLCDS